MANKGRPRSFDREMALLRAMDLFWTRGYDGTSITDLTAAMGINRPSLYAAFGSKEALFREAVALYDAVEGAPIQRALDEASTAREAVEAMLRLNAEAYCASLKPRGCMIVLAALTGTAESDPVHGFLAEARRAGQQSLEARLERGLAEGDLPDSANATRLGAFVTTVLQGLSVQARDGATGEELQRLVDDTMTAFDALVTPRHPAGRLNEPPADEPAEPDHARSGRSG